MSVDEVELDMVKLCKLISVPTIVSSSCEVLLRCGHSCH